MKRIAVGLLAILMLMSSALAYTAEDAAYAMAGVSNDLLLRTETREEPLFTSVQELEDIGLGFSSDDGRVSLICLYDAAQETVCTSMLLTSDPTCVRDVLYSGCAMMMLQDDQAGMEKVAALFDSWCPEIIAAMPADEFYSQTCYDCEGFDVELMVTPLDEKSRLTLIFYWKE